MAHWIKDPDHKNTYTCSACGGVLTTASPISYWTRCPFCHADMEEETNGDTETEENS